VDMDLSALERGFSDAERRELNDAVDAVVGRVRRTDGGDPMAAVMECDETRLRRLARAAIVGTAHAGALAAQARESEGLRAIADSNAAANRQACEAVWGLTAERDTLRVRVAELEGAGAIALIAAERRRQVEVEGWTPEHDDAHDADELARAATVYAMPAEPRRHWSVVRGEGLGDSMWPADWGPFKPSPDDRVRELVKAGALIVAEIERLHRARAAGTGGADA
ncbi:MAG: hypothetical protein ACYC1Z_14690, partial [Georgenia sp.]